MPVNFCASPGRTYKLAYLKQDAVYSNRFIFVASLSRSTGRVTNMTSSLLELTQVWKSLKFVFEWSQKLELQLSMVFLTSVSHARMEKRAECGFVVKHMSR